MASTVPITTAVAGSTGLVGSGIVRTLQGLSSAIPCNHIFARHADRVPSGTTLVAHANPDSEAWAKEVQELKPPAQVFFSALGTTRARVGGVEAQRKVDLDLNFALAKAAREAGANVYVLISSQGANASSRFAYSQMKGQLEDQVKGLGFEHTVILRPGLLMGQRRKGEERTAEGIFQGTFSLMGKIAPKSIMDSLCQSGDVVARAAVRLGLECLKGERDKGVVVVGGKEIANLGGEDGVKKLKDIGGQE